CLRRFLAGTFSESYRPGRDGFTGNKSCTETDGDSDFRDWARQSARWENGTCHRSLYSYQLRTALALAVESPHLAVTFIPLACSGATIATGFLNGQRINECPNPGTSASCPAAIRAQIDLLSDTLA